MNRYSWLLAGLIVVSVSLGVGVAEAGVIFPINDVGTPNQTSPVTVSLFDLNGRDVTDTWLPTWEPTGGPTVYVTFNALGAAAAPATVTLQTFSGTPVFNGSNPFLTLPPTTSAYPGRCTNYGSETTTDYTFVGTAVPIANTGRMGYTLRSEDCGGMAVIQATFQSPAGAAGIYLFVIPQDSNRNGIADIWETKFCPNDSCRLGTEDTDTGPVIPSPIGDGIAAFDEYRGFIVSGQHVSSDPRQRDLFVHLVNPQCGAPSLLGGGTPAFPNDGSGLFDNLASLVPGSQVHLLGYVPGQSNTTTTEWVDRLQSFSQQTGFQYLDPITNTVTGIAPADDRRINQNAVFPLGIQSTAATGLIHKGLRVTECLDVSATAPLGTTGIGTPDGPDNSLVYTQRIVNYIRTLIANGGNRALRVFAFENGAWVEKKKADGTATDADFVISQAMKFYTTHELTHSTKLTPTIEGTSKTSYGYHHAPGTGSVMDQTIVQKVDKSTSGFNSFYIPSTYNGSDQGSYKTQ